MLYFDPSANPNGLQNKKSMKLCTDLLMQQTWASPSVFIIYTFTFILSYSPFFHTLKCHDKFKLPLSPYEQVHYLLSMCRNQQEPQTFSFNIFSQTTPHQLLQLLPRTEWREISIPKAHFLIHQKHQRLLLRVISYLYLPVLHGKVKVFFPP